MKKISLLFVLLFALSASYAQEKEIWLVKMSEAKSLARESNKPILISFSGSDWCGNCMRLSKELFETEDFLAYAEENLVLLNLDFPAKKANRLSEELQSQNDQLAEKYNKQGQFPLTLLVDENGAVLGPVKYPCSTVEEYLKSIESLKN